MRGGGGGACLLVAAMGDAGGERAMRDERRIRRGPTHLGGGK